MCEYCGCQDIATIAELTREHDTVVAEIARVRTCVRGGDTEGAARSARRIRELLGPHTVVEEHGLFPYLAFEFPDHILKEQDGLFPASLAVLDTPAWAEVEAVRARAGSGGVGCSGAATSSAVGATARAHHDDDHIHEHH